MKVSKAISYCLIATLLYCITAIAQDRAYAIQVASLETEAEAGELVEAIRPKIEEGRYE